MVTEKFVEPVSERCDFVEKVSAFACPYRKPETAAESVDSCPDGRSLPIYLVRAMVGLVRPQGGIFVLRASTECFAPQITEAREPKQYRSPGVRLSMLKSLLRT
jgi:hypothetical protein